MDYPAFVSFLLDTNIVSEWTKPAPNPGLMAWSEKTDASLLYLCSVSLAEIRVGVDILPDGRRRDRGVEIA